jgi:four helix bundle protein
MRSAIKHFTDLEVWQRSKDLCLAIYRTTSKFPKSELFGLTNQLRRATTSISANIAEGMGKRTYSDRARFYYNARGSAYEVESFLIISKELDLLTREDFERIINDLNSTRMLLNAFIAKTLKMGELSQ